MKKKTYSKINDIPQGTATDKICEGCLIAEGGAFRGIYGAAVMDALMENGINMSCLVGVSAGALNGMNYISGQIGRASRITLTYRHDKNYVGYKAFLKDKGIFGFSYAFGDVMKKHPFDMERFKNSKQRFVIVTTNLETGEAEYFEKDRDDILKVLQASSSLPYVSKSVKINGIKYYDGGCADKIPVDWAIQNNFKKIIVIKTQHDDYRKDATSEKTKKIANIVFGKHKKFADLIATNNELYNKQLKRVEELKNSGDIFVISPSEPVKVTRFEKDIEKIGDLYMLGYNDAKKLMPEIKKYLEI